jgi:hypothetical protein
VINLVALLDESLEDYIAYKGTFKGRQSLNDKIELLDKAGLLNNAAQLHQLRIARNGLAHSGIAIDNTSADWNKLDGYVEWVSETLQHLGMVDGRPKFEFFFERTRVEPQDNRVALSFLHKYGLRRDGEEVLTIEYRTDHRRLSEE